MPASSSSALGVRAQSLALPVSALAPRRLDVDAAARGAAARSHLSGGAGASSESAGASASTSAGDGGSPLTPGRFGG